MLTLFLTLIAAYSTVLAQPAPEVPTGLDYKIDANLTYFHTETNFMAGGSAEESLPNGGYFTDIIGRFTYTQDLNKTQRVYGGFTYSQTESYNGVNTRQNSGFNELLLGGQMWVRYGDFRLVPSGDLVYPLYRVDRGSDDVPLGEGAMKVRAASWILWPQGNLIPFFYLGYEYRDEGRAHAIPYSLGAKYKLDKAFWLQGEFRGYERLFDNADTENRGARDVFLQQVSGGSYRYYPINPAMSEIAGSLGYSFGTITAYGELAYTINGSSVASGLTALVGLSYSPAGSTGSSDTDYDSETIRRQRNEPIEEFGPADDGILLEPDPRLPPPPPPPPRQAPRRQAPPSGGDVQLQMRKAPAKPRVKKPVRKKKDKLDNLLKDTEKTLQGL